MPNPVKTKSFTSIPFCAELYLQKPFFSAQKGIDVNDFVLTNFKILKNNTI